MSIYVLSIISLFTIFYIVILNKILKWSLKKLTISKIPYPWLNKNSYDN